MREGPEFIAVMTGLVALLVMCGCVAWVFVQVEDWIKANQISKGVLALYISASVACAALIITFSYMGAV